MSQGGNQLSKIVLSILITIILAGCNGFLHRTISQPEGRVIIDGEQYTMVSGNYEWKEDNVEIRTKSSTDINELAELFETVEVDKGEILKFEIEKNPISNKVTKLNEDGTTENIEMNDNEILMPSESGYYIYQLETIWSQGKQTFIFDVDIK